MSLNKVLAVVAAAVVLCAGAGSASAVVNGGFETGDFTGWLQFPSGPGQQTIVTPGASGTYAACIDNTVATSGSVIKNANVGIGVVAPGSNVTISFDARGAGAIGGVAFAEFFSEISGGGVSASEILGGAPLALNADPNVWTSFSFTTTAGPDVSGGVTVQFGAITAAAGGSTSLLCVDNLSVIVDGVVATDQSSWGQIKSVFE